MRVVMLYDGAFESGLYESAIDPRPLFLHTQQEFDSLCKP